MRATNLSYLYGLRNNISHWTSVQNPSSHVTHCPCQSSTHPPSPRRSPRTVPRPFVLRNGQVANRVRTLAKQTRLGHGWRVSHIIRVFLTLDESSECYRCSHCNEERNDAGLQRPSRGVPCSSKKVGLEESQSSRRAGAYARTLFRQYRCGLPQVVGPETC